MLKYGTDKPDLRNPIVISDVTEIFRGSGFARFRRQIARDGRRGARDPGAGRRAQPRSFFDKLNDWAQGEGAPGLGYIVFATATAPRARSRATSSPSAPKRSARRSALEDGDAVFFVCGKPERVRRSSPARRARSSARSSAWSRRARSASAGSSISRCTS